MRPIPQCHSGLTPIGQQTPTPDLFASPSSAASTPPSQQQQQTPPQQPQQPIDLFGGAASGAGTSANATAAWDKSQNLFSDSFGDAGGYGAPDAYQTSGDYQAASNPYAAPQPAGYGSAYGAVRPHRAPLVFILGLIGALADVCFFFFCCCPGGIPGAVLFVAGQALGLGMGIGAWVMGKNDIAAIDQGQMDPSGRGLTVTGYVFGIIGVVLAAVLIVIAIALLVLMLVVGITFFSQQKQGGDFRLP